MTVLFSIDCAQALNQICEEGVASLLVIIIFALVSADSKD